MSDARHTALSLFALACATVVIVWACWLVYANDRHTQTQAETIRREVLLNREETLKNRETTLENRRLIEELQRRLAAP